MELKNKSNFKETEIGLIPEDWGVDSIGNVSLTITDYVANGSFASLKDNVKYSDTKEYAIMIRFIDFNREFSGNFVYVNKKGYDFLKKTKLFGGEIIISNVGAYAGTVFKVPFIRSPMTLGPNSIMLKTRHNDDFYYYWLKSIYGRDSLQDIKSGSAVPKFNKTDFKKIFVPVPPIKEQEKIAEILLSLDNEIELNQKINSNLEKIASLLFKQWFVDFEFPNENGKPFKSSGGRMIDSELGEIPEGWKISKIGDELNTILGGTPRRNNDDYWYNGNIPWINSGAINNFPIIESSEFITKKGLDSSATKLMPVKTVVLPFVISLGKEIKISILGIETSGNQSVLGIIENERFSAEYIYYWIEKNKNSIYGWATGGAQQHINKQNVDGTSILIPPKDIMDKFRVITVPIFDNIISNSILNKQVEKLRDSLLPRLMSGKIRVNKKYE